MIQILADSPDDAALIARAVGSDARIVDDPVRFANGGGHVECLILGCRHPIPTEKTELLRKIERDTPWVPVIVVTDRAPEAARLLSDIRVAAVIWFANLRTELKRGISSAKQSILLLRLAAQAEEAKLPPALRSGVVYSFSAATRQPVRGVKELAEAVSRSPTTLSEQFRESVGATANLSGFLSALTVLKAHELRLSGVDWDAVAKHLGFTRQTLHNKSTRWPGSTLKQLARMRQAPLHAKFLAEFAQPLLNPGRQPLPSPRTADRSLFDRVRRFQSSLARHDPRDSESAGDTAASSGR